MNIRLQKLAVKFASTINTDELQKSYNNTLKKMFGDGENTLSVLQEKIGTTNTNFLKNQQYWLIPWKESIDAMRILSNSKYTQEIAAWWKGINDNLQVRQKNLINAIGQTVNPQYIKQVQMALKNKGMNLGNFGPNKDGIDGIWGAKSMQALYEFQVNNNLPITITLNPETVQKLGIK